MPSRRNILVIGASGMVGMATTTSLNYYTDANITACSRPPENGEPEKRAQREQNYTALRSNTGLMDKHQARWLLRDHHGTTSPGTITHTTDLPASLAAAPEIIVIAAGIARNAPRAEGEKYSPLIPLNTPYFADLANQIADQHVATLRHNARAPFPTIINTTNPVDTMTELLVKTISRRLSAHMRKAVAGHETALATQLGKTIRTIPIKILGQGGVIDGARAAGAISLVTGVALDDIAFAPVLGPHNAHMVVNFDAITVKQDGKSVPLSHIHPLTQEEKDRINTLTRKGAGDVLEDTKAKTGQAQTAVFATAAAITVMVDAATSEIPTRLCASAYDTITGRAIGRPISLSSDGAKPIPLPAGDDISPQLRKGAEALATAYGAVESILGTAHDGP